MAAGAGLALLSRPGQVEARDTDGTHEGGGYTTEPEVQEEPGTQGLLTESLAKPDDVASPEVSKEAVVEERISEEPQEVVVFEAQKPRVFPKQEIKIMIREGATEAGLNPDVVEAVADCESKLDQFALSKRGAKGIFQIIDETWVNILNKFLPHRTDMNIWDAKDNIEAGVTLWKLDGPQHWRACGG